MLLGSILIVQYIHILYSASGLQFKSWISLNMLKYKKITHFYKEKTLGDAKMYIKMPKVYDLVFIFLSS